MFSLLSALSPCPRPGTLCLLVHVLPGHRERPTAPPIWKQVSALMSAETPGLRRQSGIPTSNGKGSLATEARMEASEVVRPPFSPQCLRTQSANSWPNEVSKGRLFLGSQRGGMMEPMPSRGTSWGSGSGPMERSS